MNRRTVALAVLTAALGGCATYGPGYYADGSYSGAYNGGYYTAPADGYGDYYYDRPEVVVNGYPDYFYGPYAGFGFGYASWGFGYNPWFYRPWWGYGYHPWRGDGDHDADDWGRRHWSGQGQWPHSASTGRSPHGGMTRGGGDRHTQPPGKHGPTP